MVLAGLLSCGRDADISKIRKLEKLFSRETDAEKKSELANILHKEYSLYHLESDPDTAFLMNWAKMAMAGGEYEQARDVYSLYIEIDQKNHEVHMKRGLVNARLGFFKQAALDYARATSLMEENNQKTLRCIELSAFYDYCDSVITVAGENIASGKDIVRNRLLRAKMFMECNHFAAAKADIDVVLKHDSLNADGNFLLARLGVSVNDLALSEYALTKYFMAASDNDAAYGDALRMRDEIDRRLKLEDLANRLLESPNDYHLLIDAGSVSFRLKEYQKALVYCNRLTTAYPDSVFGYLYRGQIGIQKGKFVDALNDFERVVTIDPENISARNLKAYVYLITDDTEQLKREIDLILSRDGELLDVLKPWATRKQ